MPGGAPEQAVTLMRWIAQQLRTGRRPESQAVAPGPPGSPTIRLCRLSHIIVVMTNVLQLVFMLSFLTLLLMQLDETITWSWFAIFLPLWASDAITFLTGAQELRRLLLSSPDHLR